MLDRGGPWARYTVGRTGSSVNARAAARGAAKRVDGARPPPHSPVAMRMKDKVVIVTGAGSGIGRATAVRMGAEGARVLCADAKGDGAEETAEQIGKAGGDAVALLVDVTNEGSCGRMVDATLARFGRITTLVNSAGVSAARRDATPAPDEWERVLGVNLSGTYFASRAALPHLAASGHGSVTNIASIFGLVGGSLSPAYAASKGGVGNRHRAI